MLVIPSGVEDVSVFEFVRGIASVPGYFCGAVAALGSFDGVHMGHRSVFAVSVEMARSLGKPAVILTFEPHPRVFFQPEHTFFLLTPLTEKLALIAECGLDGVIALQFASKLASLEPQSFIDSILIGKLQVSHVVIGDNFFFGHSRHGSVAFMKRELARLGVGIDVVDLLCTADGKAISSSRIRTALSTGDIDLATKMLGYRWFISANVIKGAGRGALLGFPTLNMMLPVGCGLAYGVYAVLFSYGGSNYAGAAYFGTRPQFEENTFPMLEVHAIDSNGALDVVMNDLGQCTVTFIAYIRPEMVFPSTREFVDRLAIDIADVRCILNASCLFG